MARRDCTLKKIALLVIINNLHARWAWCSVGPLKADPPLVGDADAVLALSISCQRLKTVAWKCRLAVPVRALLCR